MAIPENYSFPDILFSEGGIQDDIHIMSFQSAESRMKSKVILRQHFFSFLIEGEKRVYYAEKHAVIDNSQFLLLSSGNCIMSERSVSDKAVYKSITLSFEPKY